MKRILFVLPSLSAANGVASFLLNYLERMQDARLSFTVLAGENDASPFRKRALERLSVPLFFLPSVHTVGLHGFRRAVAEFFRAHHDFDAVYNNAENQSFFLFSEARRYGIPVRILHAHATRASGKPLRALRNRLLIKLATPLVTHRAACSTAAGRAFFGGREFRVFENAVDVSRFRFDEKKRAEARAAIGVSDTTMLYGFVGRFSPQKNVFFFLSLAERLRDRDVRILMVGEGEERDLFLSEVRRRELSDRLLVLPPTSDVASLYFAMDALLLPSHFEGLPVVAVEAQLSGLPCLLSDSVTHETAFSPLTLFLDRFDTEAWVAALPTTPYRVHAYDARFDITVAAKRMEEFLLSL